MGTIIEYFSTTKINPTILKIADSNHFRIAYTKPFAFKCKSRNYFSNIGNHTYRPSHSIPSSSSRSARISCSSALSLFRITFGSSCCSA